MEEKGIFKAAVMGGFDRKSVLDYIKAITEQAENKEKELTMELLETTKRCDELMDMCAENEEKSESLQRELDDGKIKYNQIKEKAREMNEKINKQDSSIEAKTDELLLMKERVRQLQARNEMLELKSKKYDESTMQLGYLMLEAQKNADKIIKEANVKAEEIIAKADEAVVKTVQGLEVVKTSYGDLKKEVAHSVTTMLSRLDEVDELLEESKLFIKKGQNKPEALQDEGINEDISESVSERHDEEDIQQSSDFTTYL
ncbi:MAG: hypothetical protein RR263_00315 [Oscillospiraceae bacterium]